LKAVPVVLGCLMSVVKLVKCLLNLYTAYLVGDHLTAVLEALKAGMCCQDLWCQRTRLKEAGTELTRVLSAKLRRLSSGPVSRRLFKRENKDRGEKM